MDYLASLILNVVEEALYSIKASDKKLSEYQMLVVLLIHALNTFRVIKIYECMLAVRI